MGKYKPKPLWDITSHMLESPHNEDLYHQKNREEVPWGDLIVRVTGFHSRGPGLQVKQYSQKEKIGAACK